MYRNILLALDHTPHEQALIEHVARLAAHTRARLLLLHVADGWVARNYDALPLAESEEMKEDRAYLERTAARLRDQGLEATIRLARGNPPHEILAVAEEEGCDLIAMTTHGHRFLSDLFLGSTIETVRHKCRIPILIVRGAAP
ncbi:MAG: universal stress protein [Verrucomicrobiae bacterium]|nr:universal stress protein [Verrucomicrobiae bacterium]